MELVELLDKIDETAPRSCQTCVHMATHRGCNGCLDAIEGDARNGFVYHNWKPGNWLRALQEAEENGDCNIVIGGQGEAEVNAKWTPERTAKHLHYVSEQCGYMCGNLHKRTRDVDTFGDTCIEITTHDGTFSVNWKDGKLFQIWNLSTPNMVIWPRY